MTYPIPRQPLSGHARAIVRALLLGGPQSRTELAAALDLSAGSLTRLSKPLLEQSVIVEGPSEGASGIGRPSVPLAFHHDAYRFIGVKLTKTHAYAALTRADASIEELLREPLGSSESAEVIDQVSRLVAQLRAVSPVPVHAIGVALGAHVRDRRVVTHADHLGWNNVDVAAQLEALTGVPTVVENDIVAHTQATHWFGEGQGTDSLALFTVGAGIGIGVVAHGRTITSPEAGYSLMSHFPLEARTLLAYADQVVAAAHTHNAEEGSFEAHELFHAACGHYACASAMLTLHELEERTSRYLGREVTFEQLLGLARAGDPVARPLLDASGYALGTVFAALANITLTPRIVLGGEACELARVTADAVARGLHDHRDSRAQDPAIRIQDPDLALWTRGAAVIAMHDTLLGRD